MPPDGRAENQNSTRMTDEVYQSRDRADQPFRADDDTKYRQRPSDLDITTKVPVNGDLLSVLC